MPTRSRRSSARAASLAVAALKAMTGEALGASGALQVDDLIETLRDGLLPGVPVLEAFDPEVRLRPSAASRKVRVERARVSAAGLRRRLLRAGARPGGLQCEILVARCPPVDPSTQQRQCRRHCRCLNSNCVRSALPSPAR